MGVDSITVAAVLQEECSHHLPGHKVYVRFEDCVILLRSNEAAIADRLRNYYRVFVCAEAPPDMEVVVLEAPAPSLNCTFRVQPCEAGKSAPKEEACDVLDGRLVRKTRTGMFFAFGDAGNLAIGPCGENFNQVVNFVNSRYIERVLGKGRLLLHAAGVCGGTGGLALAGVGGSGKSTLALHLLNRGLSFVSNDRLMVARDGADLKMHGLAKMPRVNPGTIMNNPSLRPLLPDQRRQEIEKLTEEELWRLDEKYDVDIARLFGSAKLTSSARVVAVVVLNWRRDGGAMRLSKVRLGGRRDLVRAIMKPPGVFFLAEQCPGALAHSEADYLRLLEARPVMEVSGGVDFAGATEQLLTFLERMDRVKESGAV
jgi:HprK-related kinase B